MRLLTLASLLLSAAPLLAGPKVAIVVGPSAPALERFAATEMASQLKALFDADVTVGDKPAAEHVVLLGSPATNPAVKDAIGDLWPKALNAEGHVLKSTAKGLVVGGGSPVATLWAAYSLGHHFGIRAFLHGDVYPEKAPPFTLDRIDIEFHPLTKIRGWRVLGSSPTGFGAWTLDDHKRFLRQLAKLKFNTVEIEAPKEWAPIVVGGDTAGRKAFRGAKVFENPDLAGGDFGAKSRALMKGIAAAASELGIEADRPTELRHLVLTSSILPGAQFWSGFNQFILVSSVPGDQNLWAYSASISSFRPAIEKKEILGALYRPSLGEASTERVKLGMREIENSRYISDKDDFATKFGTPTPGMVADELAAAAPPPEAWRTIRERYTDAMNEMYRGIRSTYNEPARAPLLYHAKRCEFAAGYITSMEAVRLAGVARAKGDRDATVMHLEKAVEAAYNALNAYGDVARDPGDRGAIAVLNATLYRPLKAELKAAEKK